MLRGLFRLFRRKKPFDDAAKSQFADAIAGMLELQKIAGEMMDASIEDENGCPKRKALGYVYGYVDAALRSIGQDMADTSVGVPVIFQVIRKLWPNREVEYMDFLVKDIRSNNDLMMVGVMHGGQQYADYSKPGALKIAFRNPPYANPAVAPIEDCAASSGCDFVPHGVFYSSTTAGFFVCFHLLIPSTEEGCPMMWWQLPWKVDLAVVVAIMCLQYAIENAKTAREAAQIWQPAQAASLSGR
jgi:hypothetical protein